jgi:hypothetical protein
MGIAERERPVTNAAFTNMASVVVLRHAISAAKRLRRKSDSKWQEIADGMYVPQRGKAIISHDGYRRDEEKGATPDPLTGLWPFGYPLGADEEQATLKLYLGQAEDYVGSPMLSAFYGVWAARAGDSRLALKLLDEGYAKFSTGRFSQILEYRPDKFPEQPRAGPFFANMGGFLMGLLFGLPGLAANPGKVETWSERSALFPDGWQAIEADRIWIRGRPMRLVANNGESARLEPIDG